MLRHALGIAAAALMAISSAEARTILVSDVLSQNGGAKDGDVFDLGDIAIAFHAPDVGPDLRADAEPAARSGGDFARQLKARSESRLKWNPVYIEIIVKNGAKITNFNFSNKAAGRLIADGTSYRFGDVGNLAFKAPVVMIVSRGDRFALESFDVTSLETPLPGAAYLMVAGLIGIGFAMSRRKRN